MEEMVKLVNVSKKFIDGEKEVWANKNISFSIEKGEIVVILGPSGAGKSTLLNLIGGMDTPTEGDIYVNGSNISYYNRHELCDYRRKEIGFIFQFYNLMPNLTALENVELATELSKDALDPKEVLTSVGLKDRMSNFPSQLSGGEQQRVSIARAIAKNSQVLLCDEPTGALDYLTGKQILSVLINSAKEYKKTVIIVTHNSALKDLATTVIKIKNGTISSLYKNEKQKDVEEIER